MYFSLGATILRETMSMSEKDMLRFLSIKVVIEQNLSLLLDLKLLFLLEKKQQQKNKNKKSAVKNMNMFKLYIPRVG